MNDVPRYRLAIFDFDGTLADSFSWFLVVVNRLADEHGFRRMEEHEVETLRGRSARQMVADFGVPAWKLPRIGRDFRRYMTQDIARISLFPGVDRLLRGLTDQGIRTAVVTSNSIDNVRRVLGPENAALIRHYAWRRRTRKGSPSERCPGAIPTPKRSGNTAPRRCSRPSTRSSRKLPVRRASPSSLLAHPFF